MGRSFPQLFELEPKHCVVNNGDHLSRFDQSQNPIVGILASDWMRKTTGCLTEPEVPFFRFLGVTGIEGADFMATPENFEFQTILDKISFSF